jgi:hypothetical protein
VAKLFDLSIGKLKRKFWDYDFSDDLPLRCGLVPRHSQYRYWLFLSFFLSVCPSCFDNVLNGRGLFIAVQHSSVGVNYCPTFRGHNAGTGTEFVQPRKHVSPGGLKEFIIMLPKRLHRQVPVGLRP